MDAEGQADISVRDDPEISRRPLVVVVEDHPLHARLLRHALQARLDCAVELYADGLSARRRLADRDRPAPALLVLDLDLPGRSGHELLADRAGDDRLAGVPAVIVTSSALDADRTRSLALGARLHLEKPADAAGFDDLAGRLALLLDGAG